MAGKRDKAVVSVISGLTQKQAASITRDIMVSKQKHAPQSRGTAAISPISAIGKLLQNKQRKLRG